MSLTITFILKTAGIIGLTMGMIGMINGERMVVGATTPTPLMDQGNTGINEEGDKYQGDGTFYGAGGNGANGACMLAPGFNGVGTTVAINHVQFENGAACGKCVRIQGDGSGLGMTPVIGPIYATIDNECPECKHGDIDLGLNGDGRWNIQWNFVSCDEARDVNRRALSGKNLRGSSYTSAYTSYISQ